VRIVRTLQLLGLGLWLWFDHVWLAPRRERRAIQTRVHPCRRWDDTEEDYTQAVEDAI
jgi:hypothetical protein